MKERVSTLINEPIRILHVLGNLNYEGAQTFIMNIYRNIDRTKIQFDFIIHAENKTGYAEEITKLGGKIYLISNYKLINDLKYKKEWNSFFEYHDNYKIIHAHVRSTASIFLKIAKKNSLITIAHSHSTYSRGNYIERKIKDLLQKNIVNYSDYLFACSVAAGEWLFGPTINTNRYFRVINNGIDCQKYKPDLLSRKKIRNELNIEDKFVIGHVGSFTSPKNHIFLINMFEAYHKIDKNAVLVLVGNGVLKPEIDSEIRKLKLQNYVKLLGVRSDINVVLQGFDIFVFPSKFEGLGIALIEAQANGLPCIISDTIPEEANISSNNISLSINDTKENWVNAIALRNKTGRDFLLNQKVIDKGFDIIKVAKEMEEFYCTL